jgi:hypothetical protein
MRCIDILAHITPPMLLEGNRRRTRLAFLAA